MATAMKVFTRLRTKTHSVYWLSRLIQSSSQCISTSASLNGAITGCIPAVQVGRHCLAMSQSFAKSFHTTGGILICMAGLVSLITCTIISLNRFIERRRVRMEGS